MHICACRQLDVLAAITTSVINVFSNSYFDDTQSTVSLDSSHNDSVSDRDLFVELSNIRKKNPRNFIVTHININSLQHKFDELSIILSSRLVDCLCVSETKFNDSHLSERYKVPNYHMFRKDNNQDGGGGLVCYLRSDIPAYDVKPDCGPMEGLQVNCVMDKMKWSILCLYKKPSIPQRVIRERMDAIIDQNLNLCDKYIILGDLNCNMFQTNTAVHQLCTDFNLTNIIKEPTCFKGENPSLIDVMLVSDKSSCKGGHVTPCPLSDFHKFITGVFKVCTPRTTSKRIFLPQL